MAAPAGEVLGGEFNAYPETNIPEEDVIFDALQQHLGEAVRLRHYDALWRKDYEGDASSKRYVGGALLVDYVVFADDEFKKGELVVVDGMLPEVRGQLEARARKNWNSNRGWVRDYGRGSNPGQDPN